MNEESRSTSPKALDEAPAPFRPSAPSERAPDREVPELRPEDLPGRDLRGQDLTGIEGLLPEHLAGADLTGARLPDDIAKFPALGQVAAISAEARKLFIGLLAACVYSWLVIGTTRDVQLILNTASSPLPIINTPIPIAGFYVVGASVLAAVYCYLHFYLQRLWRTLATLPAVFLDGAALDDATDPWLLTNLVRLEFKRLRPNAPPLARLENLLAVFLAWWLVPLTLLALWARYLPAHGWLGTTWLVLLTGLTTLFGRHTYNLARAALQGDAASSPAQGDASGGVLRRAGHELSGLLLHPGRLTIWLTVALAVCSISAFRDNPRGPYTWVAKGLNALNFIGIRTYADLREVDVAQPPQPSEGWDGKDPSKVRRVDLRGVNLVFADAGSAFFANADLRDAQLQGADLSYAELQGADLTVAELQGANFWHAQLQGANFTAARLQGAVLQAAQLQGAELEFAYLEGANLHDANLRGADLTGARLQGADLVSAQLQGADLSYAKLQGAVLESAELQAANLQAANLRGASLEGNTNLQGANLQGAALWRTVSGGVRWDLADLRGINVQPLAEAEIDHIISTVAAALADERKRKQTVELLTSALRDDDRPARPEFPREWRSQPPNVMFERGDPESFEWGPRKWATERDYDEDLAMLLAVLACGREVPQAQTRALAARAVRMSHELWLVDRAWPRLFAKHLTGPGPPAKGVREDIRRQLEQLAARGDGAAAMPEASSNALTK